MFTRSLLFTHHFSCFHNEIHLKGSVEKANVI